MSGEGLSAGGVLQLQQHAGPVQEIDQELGWAGLAGQYVLGVRTAGAACVSGLNCSVFVVFH